MTRQPDYLALPEEVYNYSDLFKVRLLFCFTPHYEEVRIFAQRFGLGLRRRDSSEVRVPDRPLCVWATRLDQVIGHPHMETGFVMLGPIKHTDNELYDALNCCKSRYYFFGRYER